MLILPKGYRKREGGFIINPYAYGAAPTDPYFANVVLLLSGQGTHGSTTIPDLSGSAHTVTVFSPTAIDTSSFPSGCTSAINLNSGGLEIPDHANFDMGSGDFTLETYQFFDTTSVFPLLLNKKNGTNFSPFQMLAGNADTQQFYRASSDGTTYGASQISGSTPFAVATWVHSAYCRGGTTFYSWLQGATLVATTTMSGALTTNSDKLCIGRTEGGASNLLSGRIAWMRITKGVNRYPTTFTPPTLPLPTS